VARCLWIPLIATLIFSPGSGTASAQAPEGPLKIGMVQGMFRDVQPNVVHALARPFRTLMEKQSGLTGEVEICPDALTMAKKLHDQKLEIGVFHGFEYAWAKSKYNDLVPISVAVPQGKIVQAHLVVHADSPLKKIAELEGESILIPRGAKAHCLLYLEKARSGIAKTHARTVPKTGMTPEEVLNAVAMGEQPAALVDAASLVGYQSLQPGAAKQLRILASSELFPQSLLAARKGGLSDATITRLREGLTTAHKTAQYKPLMMMWNLQGFEEIPTTYENDLQKCLLNYPVPAMQSAQESVNNK
jgi:ABC-type phosphate/phosphonate transport system substrate-binding protein